MTCKIDGCTGKAHAKQLCLKHYHRVLRTGRTELHSIFRDAVIASMPGAIPEITAKAGVSRTTAQRWVRDLRKEGNSHIGKWQAVTPQLSIPVHVFGAGKDAPRPRVKTHAEHCLAYRKRNRDKIETYNSRRNARYHADKKISELRKAPQSWLSSLM